MNGATPTDSPRPRIQAKWLWLLAGVVGLAIALALTDTTDEDAPAVPVPHERPREQLHDAAAPPPQAPRPIQPAPGEKRLQELLGEMHRALEQWRDRPPPAPLSQAARQAWSSPQKPTLPAPGSAGNGEAAAPAFPYQWIGRMVERQGNAQDASSAPMAVIAGPRNTWVLKRGDVIESQWRIDQIGASGLQVTYLPLGTSQTLSMASP